MGTLFHYCSSSTFASIVSRKSIWLSSLSLSNDTMEGRLVTETFERMMAQSEIDAEEMEHIRESLKLSEGLLDGLGFCLSAHEDHLSQWRGYADDGQGFSIGFAKEYLEKFAEQNNVGKSGFMRLDKVLYEPAEHEAALRPIYDEIKAVIDSGSLKKPRNALLGMIDKEHIKMRSESIKTIWLKAVKSSLNAYMLKNKAFSEEAEWRLLSWLAKGQESGDSASFRASGNRLVPYREFKLEPLDVKSIAKVFIGPKNITPKFVIEKFLSQEGFSDVLVEHSSATYR